MSKLVTKRRWLVVLPVDPFIDPEGYRAYIDNAEAEFRRGVVH